LRASAPPQARPQADTRTNTAIVQASRQTRPLDKRAQTAFLPLLPGGPATACYKTGSAKEPYAIIPGVRQDSIAPHSIGTGLAFAYSFTLPAQRRSAKIHRSVCPHRQARSPFSGTHPMPSIDQFIESFLTAVDFQEAVEVTPETELRSLPEWDSLAALGVIVMFDVDYGKTITGDDLKNCSTITDLYKLLG